MHTTSPLPSCPSLPVLVDGPLRILSTLAVTLPVFWMSSSPADGEGDGHTVGVGSGVAVGVGDGVGVGAGVAVG